MIAADPRRRLLELAEQHGVSLARLSRMIGKNASYLQQFVKKGSPRRLEERDRGRLARFFGVDEAELGAEKDYSYEMPVKPGRSNDWVDIPRLSLGASAGPGLHAEGEEAIGAFRFSARWLREQGLEAAKLSAIKVTGDSMEPTLRDGDEILVDCSPRPLRDGIHVVRLDDCLLVKRLETGRPGRIALLSDNQAYRPIEIEAGDVQVIGRVVWKGGRL
ncbi:MAG: transcriptional regulator [Novosphingobium sp.]|nr:transcriptional regulator [Novosphingobium sp.]